MAVKILPNEEKGHAIHAVLTRAPRKITRKNSGRDTAAQVLAANIETIFLVMAADISYNAARLGDACSSWPTTAARPVVVLNKTYLCEDLDALLAEAQPHRAAEMFLRASRLRCTTGRGLERSSPPKSSLGDTVAFIGTSRSVGKSSLINKCMARN